MGNNNKLPRTMGINFNLVKETKIEIGNLTMEIGGIIGNDGENSTDIFTYIERNGKKNKITTQYNSKKNNIPINVIDYIEEFDYMFVVDTNTEAIDIDTNLCVGVVGQIVKIEGELALNEAF